MPRRLCKQSFLAKGGEMRHSHAGASEKLGLGCGRERRAVHQDAGDGGSEGEAGGDQGKDFSSVP